MIVRCFHIHSPGTALLGIMICLSVFFLPGCAARRPLPIAPSFSMEEYPRSLLRQAMEWNRDIVTARGKGWLTIDSPEIRARFRMIWAAGVQTRNQTGTQKKAQARITLLEAGLPVETIIINPDKQPLPDSVFSRARRAGTSRIRKVTNRNAKYFFPVDVPVEHIVRLLLGQIPLASFVRAESSFHGPDTASPVAIITEDQAQDLQQKITWNDQGIIQQIRMETPSRAMSHGITFSLWKQNGQYRIPHRITMVNEKGERMVLSITALKPNASIKSWVFSTGQ